MGMLNWEPFLYPEFDLLRNRCINLFRSGVSDEELNDCLTCLALDNEEEIILDELKEIMDDALLERYVKAGVHHLQPEGRWQIAELLCCRDIPNREEYLRILCCDKDAYVVKRAKNAVEELKVDEIIV